MMQDRRLSRSKRGYDRAWQRLRLAHLRCEPLCRYCAQEGRTAVASVVDHIVPIREAPERRLDPSNLQSLCASCHSALKQAEERGSGRRGCGADGLPLDPMHPWHASGG